jgi:hypothetical protein
MGANSTKRSSIDYSGGRRASFGNAVWHLGRQYPHEVFVRDCWGALRRQIAPHQVFAGT